MAPYREKIVIVRAGRNAHNDCRDCGQAGKCQVGDIMPVHDWTRVEAGIFHAFHHDWITELARALNRGILPEAFYALPEQHAAGFGPDVLTLQGAAEETEDTVAVPRNGGLLVAA